jgi:hypothetical protein
MKAGGVIEERSRRTTHALHYHARRLLLTDAVEKGVEEPSEQ